MRILTNTRKIIYLDTVLRCAIIIFLDNSVTFHCFYNIIDIQSKFDWKRIRATYLVLVLLLSRFNSWNQAKNFIKVDPLRNSPLMKFKG